MIVRILKTANMKLFTSLNHSLILLCFKSLVTKKNLITKFSSVYYQNRESIPKKYFSSPNRFFVTKFGRIWWWKIPVRTLFQIWKSSSLSQDGCPWREILYVSFSPLRGLVRQFYFLHDFNFQFLFGSTSKTFTTMEKVHRRNITG